MKSGHTNRHSKSTGTKTRIANLRLSESARRQILAIMQISFVTTLVTCAAGAMGTFAFTDCPCIPRPFVRPSQPFTELPEQTVESGNYVDTIE